MIVHKIQSNNTRWEAFHSEYLLVPNVTAFYEKGILYEPLNYKQMFTIHKTYFTSHHRTSDTKIISNYYLNNIDSYDFVVVADLEKIPFLFNNEISNAVSTAVTKKVKSSPDIWVLDTTILTSTYGKLSLYTNILNKNATFNNNN
ncbi:MAG: hypothetical protein PF481_07450 [Bacteroidales bacterium]|nr:hypothetical protein [Bacteroidales bacterium]